MADDNNEKFKLVTRRYLAWGAVGIAILTLAFAAGWSVVNGVTALATLTLGMLGNVVIGVIAFYFAKKTSEE
ncbi:hypothetical protein ES703_49299 [subsurface metagenome]